MKRSVEKEKITVISSNCVVKVKKNKVLLYVVLTIIVLGCIFLIAKAVNTYSWNSLQSSEIVTSNTLPQKTSSKKDKNVTKMKVVLESAMETEEVEDTSNKDIDLNEMRNQQLENLLKERGLTLSDYVNNQNKIEESILAEVESLMEEYDRKLAKLESQSGVPGPAGKDGKDGEDGKDGKDGKNATGTPGKDGEDGKDGISSFIRYAETSSPTDAQMSKVPTDSTVYIGTYEGTKAGSTKASNYIWSPYKDLSVTYSNGTVHFIRN